MINNTKKKEFEEDGYVLLRNQIPLDKIDESLEILTKEMTKICNCIDTNKGNLMDLFSRHNGILLTGFVVVFDEYIVYVRKQTNNN